MNHYLFLIFALLAPWQQVSAHPPLDVVLDLDWTLLYSLPEEPIPADPRAFSVEGRWYRLADRAEGVLEEILNIPGARISFFSGGERTRNLAALRHIRLPNGKTAEDIAYKILSKEDLTEVNPKAAKVADRYRKDLRKVNNDLSRVVLVDDVRTYALPGQEKNTLWLGETYNFIDDFDQWERSGKPKTEFDPPSKAAWEWERKKLSRVLNSLKDAHQDSWGRPESFLDHIRPVHWRARSIRECKGAYEALGKVLEAARQ